MKIFKYNSICILVIILILISTNSYASEYPVTVIDKNTSKSINADLIIYYPKSNIWELHSDKIKGLKVKADSVYVNTEIGILYPGPDGLMLVDTKNDSGTIALSSTKNGWSLSQVSAKNKNINLSHVKVKNSKKVLNIPSLMMYFYASDSWTFHYGMNNMITKKIPSSNVEVKIMDCANTSVDTGCIIFNCEGCKYHKDRFMLMLHRDEEGVWRISEGMILVYSPIGGVQ